MNSNKTPLIIYWTIVAAGLLSLFLPLIIEYGIVVTLIISFICSIFSWGFAMIIGGRKLIYGSAILLLSPYIMLFSLKLFS